MPIHNATRRSFLSTGLATAVGLPLLSKTCIGATKPLQQPGLPNAVTAGLKAVGTSFVTAVKNGSLTQFHIGQLSASVSLSLALAEENGSIATIQNIVTQNYIDNFGWTEQQKDQLATLVTGSQSADYDQLDNAFLSGRSSIIPNVSQNIAILLTGLQTLTLPASTASFYLRHGTFDAARVRRVGYAGFCTPALYGAVAGLLAAASWELPPVAFAFGLLAFGYAVEAAFVC